jgi:hypothetical protein
MKGNNTEGIKNLLFVIVALTVFSIALFIVTIAKQQELGRVSKQGLYMILFIEKNENKFTHAELVEFVKGMPK